MNDADLRAERELAHDLDRMAQAVWEGLQAGEPPAVWEERRRQIAALRQRIRTMRARHIAGTEMPPALQPQ
jgi:hypothetical protein